MENKKVMYTLLGAAALGVGVYIAYKYMTSDDKRDEEAPEKKEEVEEPIDTAK